MTSHVLFDDVLLETTGSERRRRKFTLFATLAGEALAIAVVIALPLLYLDAVPGYSVHAAPVDVTYHPRLQPVELVHTSGRGRSMAIERPPDEFVVPRTIQNPHLIYGRYRAMSDETVPPNVPLPLDCCGDGGGRSSSNSLVTRAVVPSPPHRPIISHLDEGMVTHRVEPSYPALAKQAHVQGEVVLRAVISKQGRIEGLQVVSGHPLLASAAADAVSQWRFRPYLLNGTPVEVETQITVRFKLGSG